ncbi:GerAB/ArcD/ProY family transporter [Clostridium botulinum]|uniref:Spore germination protein n=1 Tax=Clostridium botulinum (strain Langeland / NCTC 10281 / Type F) TaxID=441772 RepID=A7GEU1_CLOBL|nr:endospore germination permease [Clostridium botulinum]ABS42416.1 spore germination protein [Clostridium botulinum F str. Langeland]ADF99709.1 spore germination protein [Clostridium botulinum F str. 230613]MBY6791771.1 endospore germination permease [Clostridium botulinum]MBY6937008.1 endospore germination permease [Clostridium botulinum]MBY6944428.1 endospore germination permease [Clostridium botulinum]
MNNKEDALTESQLTLMVIGSIIGISLLSLPLDPIKIAKQDAWIATFLGVIYPIYVLFIAIYIRKKYPKRNILDLSKKIYGKIPGNILNLIFLLFFFLVATDVAAGINNVLRNYMVSFLNSWNILTLLFLGAAYTVYGGTKTVGRLSEILFYTTFIVFLIPVFSIKKADILNLQPVMGSGVKSIVNATKKTIIGYSGAEMLLILYPLVGENVKLKKIGFKSISFITILYTLYTLLTILYLGVNATDKFLWPVITISRSITIPVINSFSYIFLSLWTMTMFKCISVNYYLFAHGLNKIFNKISRRSWAILLYPIMLIGASLYGIPVIRRNFLDKIFPPYVIFNIIFISITALLVALGKGDKNEK